MAMTRAGLWQRQRGGKGRCQGASLAVAVSGRYPWPSMHAQWRETFPVCAPGVQAGPTAHGRKC